MRTVLSILTRPAALLLAGLFFVTGCTNRDTLPAERTPFSVQATLSTNVITIGDPVSVRWDAIHPPDARVEWPSLEEHDKLIIRERRTERASLDETLMRSSLRFVLTSFSIDEHVIETGPVRFLRPDEDPLERELPPRTLTVQSVIETDEPALQPNKPMLEWPDRVPRWIPVFLAIATLALILGLLLSRFLTRRRTYLQHPPPPPAHETALNALRALRDKQLIERDEVESFYVELSAIVRRYLEDRFELRAPESTTEEFLREASGSGALKTDHQALVGDFLTQSDLVKFARFRPDANNMQDAFAAAEKLVRDTIPVATTEGPS